MTFKKNLSETTLKLLMGEILNGTAESEEYFFGDFLIVIKNIKDNEKNKDIKPKKKYLNHKQKLYLKRKNLGVCVLCETKTNGGIYCTTCKEKIYERRRNQI